VSVPTRASQVRRELLALGERVERLRSGALSDADHQTAFEEALAELQTSLEELRVAEEELRRQHEELVAAHDTLERERVRYRDLFEFAPDALLVTDLGGVVREANEAASELLALRIDSMRGKPLLSFVPVEERALFRAALGRAREGMTVRGLDLMLRPRVGAPFRAALTIAPMREPGGTLSELRWMVRDTSPQREAETVRMELQREQGARPEAEEAVQVRNQFIATISHDLKTPLTVI
jgi:PAS domain S-box-containing protein